MTELVRETSESTVRVSVERGGGDSTIETGDRFLDHMLTTLARYAGLRFAIRASADLRHHLVEDVAITLGATIRRMAGPTIARYGDSTVPMDDALVSAVLDVGGRAYYEGPVPSGLYDHWMRSFCEHAAATLHIRVLRGRDRHHIVEAAFKALGFALRQALQDGGQSNSAKGAVRWSAD